MADKSDIQDIKTRLDIVGVVSQYLNLKKAGRNWVGLCPFHGEKTPSFTVNPQLGTYKCFGCGKGGDVISFVQEIEHLEFKDAIEKLAKQAGVVLKTAYDPQAKSTAVLKKINLLTSEFYGYLLTKHPKGRAAYAYAKKRGLTDETIETFKIGYAPRETTLLQEYLGKKGYTVKDMTEAGLINERGNDKFNNRLMFSLFDNAGNIVGFSGRVFENGDERPKYLNTAETALFKKRFGLFGFYQAKEAILKNDLAILCEGQLDMISSFQAGIQNIIAPLGTGLTESQLLLLKRTTNNIAFIFDNDGAGQASTEKGVQIAFELTMVPYMIKLSKAFKDIDELIKKDPNQWFEAAKAPLPYFDYRFNELKSLFRKSESFKDFDEKLDKLLTTISKAAPIERGSYVRRITTEFYIPESEIRDRIDAIIDSRLDHKITQESSSQRHGAMTTVEYIMSILLNFPLLTLAVGKPEITGEFLLVDVHKKLYTLLYNFALPYKEIIITKKGVPITEKNWNVLYTEFQNKAGKEYSRYIQQIQEDTDVTDAISRLGINNEYTGVEITNDIVKDLYTSLSRLKKNVISIKLQALQEKLRTAEIQKEKPTIKAIEKEIQGYLMQLRKIEKATP